ncbi:serpin family protein [Brachybacterium paraconglomeratum]|uniref:serpin family protein n=1 Tax=Brachybacterium paraconglomeratum TaxID=173362 RepID=UPI003FD1EAAD
MTSASSCSRQARSDAARSLAARSDAARSRPAVVPPRAASPSTGTPAVVPPPAGPARRAVLRGGAVLPLATSGLAALGLAGCGGGEPGGGGPDLAAELPRAEPGPVPGAGEPVVPFTARMLGALDRAETNAVCSPLSAQVALTMIGMGAAGETRTQMEEVLGGDMDALAGTANTLSTALAAVGEAQREGGTEEDPEPATASLVNATWLQQGFEVEQAFLEDLATWFGSGVFEADFADDAAREAAREEINGWVEESTEGLIEELLPEQILTPSTRLVLVNALHLKAAWQEPLTVAGGRFTTAGGEQRSCEMLHGSTATWYEDEVCRATSLDTYGEELALALVQPVLDLPDVLTAWADAADAAGDPEGAGAAGPGLGDVLAGLEEFSATVALSVPAVDVDAEYSLKDLLEGLGMTDAFTGGADFSGITGQAEPMIDAVVQKAVLTVDENGMEAAAATAVTAVETSAQVPDQELVLDSPFLVVAYHRESLAPLVVGWIGDPTQTR